MAKKKSKEVRHQKDGSEIYGFESEPAVPKVEKKKSLASNNYISGHSKFDKFKGEKK